jgi:hypothetical protein
MLLAARRIRSEGAVPISGNDQINACLEQPGANQVRLLISSESLSAGWNVRATEWLAIKDQEELLNTSYQGEQTKIARAASNAAKQAAAAAERASIAAEQLTISAKRAKTRATVALVIAITCIIATISSMINVHRDAIQTALHFSPDDVPTTHSSQLKRP